LGGHSTLLAKSKFSRNASGKEVVALKYFQVGKLICEYEVGTGRKVKIQQNRNESWKKNSCFKAECFSWKRNSDSFIPLDISFQL